MELGDVARRVLALESLERLGAPRPVHLPELREVGVGEPLHDPVRRGDLRVRVVDRFGRDLGLGEENCAASRERLGVRLVHREHRGEALGEALLARGRAPHRLLDEIGRDLGE